MNLYNHTTPWSAAMVRGQNSKAMPTRMKRPANAAIIARLELPWAKEMLSHSNEGSEFTGVVPSLIAFFKWSLSHDL
jgi:hypothetical protein